MEALNTLQVAGGVIQFLDFGSKLLSNSRKLYRSADGVLSENVDLEVVTTDLATILLSLERKLPDNRAIKEDKSEDEKALDELCIRCVAIAEELIAHLDKLKIVSGKDDTKTSEDDKVGRGSLRDSQSREKLGRDNWSSMLKPSAKGKSKIFRKWSAFRKALEAVWRKEEIEAMAATLREFRSEIEFRILVMFRATISQLVVQQSQFSRQLTESTRAILDSFIYSRDDLATQLRGQVEKLVFSEISKRDVRARLPEDQTQIIKGELKLAGTFQYPKGAKRDEESIEELPARAYEVEESIRLLMIENGVLGSLSFDSIHDRKDSVDVPFQNTFKWIFDEPGSIQRPWSNFMTWLRQDSGIYWINGKAASGKSTLMRYLQDNEQIREGLNEWAGSVPLDICHFFFWNIGDEYQKSQKGLLRSLLHDILQQHRDLIPAIMPEAWEAWYSRADYLISNSGSLRNPMIRPDPKPWGMVQLKGFFRTLLRTLESRVKLCLFIDGLDEYDGDHYEIAEMFEDIALSSNIKLCLSSRPLLAFEQAFEGQPSLKLQDLTARDISYYVKENLYRHKYMTALSKENPAQVSDLVSDVVDKARGVFLWVKLVVRSLLRGLSDYNRISDLQRRVEYLPGDLEALYAHMLQMTDPFYHEQASKIFQIYRAAQQHCPSQLTLLSLSWADEEDEDLAEKAQILPLPHHGIANRCKAMDARLKSVCAGLLESIDIRFSDIAPDAKVLFLHRTVSDWITQPKVWSGITSHTQGKSFSPNIAMLKSCVLQLKSASVGPSFPLDLGLITGALKFAIEAEKDLNSGFPRLLDQLDIAASYHWRVGKNFFTSEPEPASVASSVNSSFIKDIRDHDDVFEFEDQEEENGIYFRQPQVSQTGILQASLSPSPGGRSLVEKTSAPYHWSKAVDVSILGCAGWPSTFYDLAVAIGLSHYARMKFESANIVDQDVEQHMLLHLITSRTDLNPSVIRRILENGTDPNLSYDGFSPWEHVLLSAAAHFNHTPCGHARCKDHPPDMKWKETSRNWAVIVRDFLYHGANPDLVTRNHSSIQGHPRLSATILFEKYFPEFLVVERDSIKSLLIQKRISFDPNIGPGDVDNHPVMHDETGDPDEPMGSNEREDGGVEVRRHRSPGQLKPTSIVRWMLSWVVRY
ncbi:unnamed protein product [Clonostachys chloroleuca]|uniref:NACHT domain-containing protein n=1 Tax=Clonostachys chloroleuca TaxID=1926264 RepID=A0AA35LV88_9HYPO|nr:unnamed protein product [Clonostachys chloroleuca]